MPDTGDAVSHFQHARYFWSHAEAALSQWGKPLYSFLASPFTLLGLWGTSAFAGICIALACLLMQLMLRGADRIWHWWVPVVCFSTPVLASTIVAGQTEPLFGLVSIAVVHALWYKRYNWAMALVSLLPFTRPEYAAFAPFAVFVVVRDRQWKALPYAFIGALVYMLSSALLLGDPWGLITHQTYVGNSIYGRGDLLHFIDRSKAIFGAPFKHLFLVCIAGAMILIWRDRAQRDRHITLFLLTVVPAVGILALHSFAWWHGGLASLGLERVMATAVPLASLFMVYTLAGLWSLMPQAGRWGLVPVALLVLYSNMSFHEVKDTLRLPIMENDIDHTVREASIRIGAERNEEERVVYLDPYLGALLEIDPWDTARSRWFNNISAIGPQMGLSKGDFVVWDAHFAAFEGGVSPDTLDADPRLGLIAVYAPRDPILTIGDRAYSIRIYRFDAPPRIAIRDTLFAPDSSSARFAVLQHHLRYDRSDRITTDTLEFPLTLEQVPFGDSSLMEEKLIVSGTLIAGLDQPRTFHVELSVWGNDREVEHRSWDVPNGPFRFEITTPPLPAGSIAKLYLWNRLKARVTIDDLTIVRTGFRLPGTAP